MRAESGNMKFGNDWFGVFIRGDRASYYSMILKELLENQEKFTIELASLKELASLLGGCNENPGMNPDGVKNCQELKGFEECLNT